MNYHQHSECKNCFQQINQEVNNYSSQYLGISLCIPCQQWFRGILNYTSATNASITLYFALRERGVPAYLEKNDGFKTIDISVPDAKVNIEVDGIHHNFNPHQALTDLDRTLHSHKNGISTLRIPNSLIRNYLPETANKITEYLIANRDRKTFNY